jgi:hypothetical protein
LPADLGQRLVAADAAFSRVHRISHPSAARRLV